MNKRTVKGTRSDGERSRETILNAAARLATVEGLEGLSIGRLAEHIGMSKSGLYAHFGSKEELQLATIETAAAIFDADVVQPAVAHDSPLARLQAFCDAFLSHLERHVFPGGCFFISVAAEFDTHPGPVKMRISELTGMWFAMLEDLVRGGQAAGEIDPTQDASQLAFELDAYLVMANMAFLLSGDVVALERARNAFATRLHRTSAVPAPV